MTQDEKSIFLKDLCARLPYGVKVKTPYNDAILRGIVDRKGVKTTIDYTDIVTDKQTYPIRYIKPYLRPLSSITEEEKEELKQISNDYLDEWENAKTSLERWKLDAKESYKRAVFYNSHHFDWNGLIEKNLALDCTGLHIYD